MKFKEGNTMNTLTFLYETLVRDALVLAILNSSEISH